jgi:hypothetical protein
LSQRRAAAVAVAPACAAASTALAVVPADVQARHFHLQAQEPGKEVGAKPVANRHTQTEVPSDAEGSVVETVGDIASSTLAAHAHY